MASFPGPTDPPGDASGLRASDSDRDRVAEVLREAAADGRLTFDELDERLGQAYAARTYAELEPITRDLPQAGSVTQAGGVTPAGSMTPAGSGWPGTPALFGGRPTSRLAIGILGGFRRRGHWVAPRDFTALAVMGGGEIDLRQASFAEGEVRIRALAVMGGIQILVPEGAQVHVHAIGIMGGTAEPAQVPAMPGAPKIVVTGLAVMGGIDVKRRPLADDERRPELR
jgi:hypothetical protein